MDFAEFLTEEEGFEAIYESALDEGLWDIAAGGARVFGGAMTVPDEAIARLMGAGTKGRMARGFGDIKGGLGRAFFGKQTPPAQAPAPVPAPTVTAADIKAVADEFARLKAAFHDARKRGDKDFARRIAARMKRVDPVSFRELEVKSREARRERDRKRWAFLSASTPQKPEDFLGRLGAEN